MSVISRSVDTDGDLIGEQVVVTVEGCSVQPRTAVENTDDREQSVTRWRVFGPVELGVARSHHLLEVPGWVVGSETATTRLSLSGNAVTWPTRGGARHHVELDAYQVTG